MLRNAKSVKNRKISQTCNRGFERWEDNFLKRQKPSRQWQKFHALAKKFLAQDIKTLAGEGAKADEREKQIRKRRLWAKEEGGNKHEMNNCWAGFFKKHLRESCHNGISPPTPVSRSVAQTGSAPRSGRGGRRFKSSHSDHFSSKIVLNDKMSSFQTSKHRKSNHALPVTLLCFACDFIIYNCFKSRGS